MNPLNEDAFSVWKVLAIGEEEFVPRNFKYSCKIEEKIFKLYKRVKESERKRKKENVE